MVTVTAALVVGGSADPAFGLYRIMPPSRALSFVPFPSLARAPGSAFPDPKHDDDNRATWSRERFRLQIGRDLAKE